MTITPQDIINRFGLPCSESLRMFVKWIDFSPNQQNPRKSEQVCVPNGIQLAAGQFAYITLKTQTGKSVFSSFIFANAETSFIKTSNQRVSTTYYNMYGVKQKNKIANVFEAYRKADEAVSFEESLPRQQRLETLAKRSGGSYDKFLGLVKSRDLINGFDRNQVAEIKRFWDARNTPSQVQQQASQMAPPAQSPFAAQQLPQTATGPAQSPFAAQQTPQTALPAQSPFAEQQPIQAPQASQTQVPQATLEGIYCLLQQLLAANTAQASVTAP
jgi:hypothetical protein